MNSRKLDFGYRLWHKTAMPIFVERVVLVILAAGVVAVMYSNPMRFDITQRVTLSLSLLFLAYFFSHTIYKWQHSAATPPQEYFTAEIMAFILNDPRLPWWVVSRPNSTIFSVDAFVKIRVVNLQNNKAKVDSISINVKGEKGWIHLRPISIQGMTLGAGRVSAVREFTVSPADIEKVFESEMGAGDTVEATGFLQSPIVLDHAPEYFRIIVRDAAGHSARVDTSGALPSDEPGLNKSVFNFFGDLQDLSSFTQRRFWNQSASN